MVARLQLWKMLIVALLRYTLAALVLSAVATTATAVPIMWSVSGNLLDNASPATQTFNGSFVFDADIGGPIGYSSVNIQTSGGGSIPATILTFVGPINSFNQQLLAASALSPGAVGLVFSFVSPLTNAGGTVALTASVCQGSASVSTPTAAGSPTPGRSPVVPRQRGQRACPSR